MEKLKPGKTNAEDRMNMVRYWAAYVRAHPDKVWSRQQAMLINAQLQSARKDAQAAKAYLKRKGLAI